jgi:hypothetical protein
MSSASVMHNDLQLQIDPEPVHWRETHGFGAQKSKLKLSVYTK